MFGPAHLFTAGILVVAFSARISWAASFTPLPGAVDNGGSAIGVSADGSTVIGRADLGSGHHEYRWTYATGMADLGFRAGVDDISADASVLTGAISTSPTPAGDPVDVFRWTSSTGIVNLGQGYGRGISADGNVIAGIQGFEGAFQGFRWTSGTGRTLIPDFLGGSLSFAEAISADGVMVVGSANSASGERAMRWSEGGGLLSLNDPAGTTSSIAVDISADGSTITGYRNAIGGGHIFRWTEATGMVDIGPLNAPPPTTVNADGSVIAGGNGFNAYVWDSVHGYRSLHSILTDLGVDVSGWQIHGVRDLSADGFTLVGSARPPGGASDVGFVAVIPEPAALTLLLTVPALFIRRRRADTRTAR